MTAPSGPGAFGQRTGGLGILRKAVLLLVRGIARMLSIPLYFARVRFLCLSTPGRIGHLASELDAFVKETLLGMRKRYYAILIVPSGTAANECFLGYWRRYVGVVQSRFWSRVFWQLQQFSYLRLDMSNAAINQTASYFHIQRAWGNRPALLQLSEKHRREGRARLAELGVPVNAEFVCFHCREAGYSPSDDAIHAYRNSNIETYALAVDELTKRGLWCIRLGDSSSKRLDPRDMVIDYAHLDIRSDWMDVFLCAASKFLLGSSSGLVFLTNAFGKASASANHAPLSAVLAFGRDDIAIPKLLWSDTQKRYLTFAEAFSSDIANLRFTNLYEARGVRTVDNTAEDIRDLALEMLEWSGGRVSYTGHDEELQRRFKALMRPGDYSYGGINRVGRDFLRKYEPLIGDR